MIIYEVNLEILKEIYSEYLNWLISHIDKMMTFPGFTRVQFLQEYNIVDEGFNKLTIQYCIDCKENLDSYLNNFAQQMREDGLKKFPNQFKASRRFFEVLVLE